MSFNLIARNGLDLTIIVENVRLQLYEQPSYPQRILDQRHCKGHMIYTACWLHLLADASMY